MMGTQTRLLTFFSSLLFALTLSAQNVSLGPERPLTGVREGPAPASLGRQSIATDGVVTYVVWSTGGTLDVSAFDRAGIFVKTTTVANLETWQPVIAYDGTSFIVSWTNATGIYAARLRDLTLDPAAGVKIADPGSRMSIASIGGLTLVAWQQGLSVRAAPFSTMRCIRRRRSRSRPTGTCRASRPTATTSASHTASISTVPAVSRPHASTLPVPLRSVSRSGSASALHRRRGVGIRVSDRVALGFRTERNIDSIRRRSIGADAEVADTRSVEFPVIESSGDRISIAWCSDEGGGGIPEMADASSIYFQQFDSEFHSLSAPVCITSSRQGAIGNWIPSIRTDGDNILTTWAEDPSRFGDSVPRYAVLAPDGTPHTRGSLAHAPDGQRRVDLATAGSVRLAVWDESSPDGYPMGAAYGRLGQDGQSLDGAGTLIGNAAFSSCSVGTDGTDFLLAWMEQDYPSATGDLYIQRIGQGGEPLGPKSLIGQPLRGAVSVEWTGNDIVGAGSALFGITRDGAAMGEPLGLTTYPFNGLWSASAGGNALFAYGLYSSERYYPTLNVVYADPSGAVGPREVASQVGAGAVATNGEEFFVPYNDRSSALPHGIRFRMDGSIIGEVVGFAGKTAEIFDPRAAAWDGEAFVVLYSTTDWPQTHLVVARAVPGNCRSI